MPSEQVYKNDDFFLSREDVSKSRSNLRLRSCLKILLFVSSEQVYKRMTMCVVEIKMKKQRTSIRIRILNSLIIIPMSTSHRVGSDFRRKEALFPHSRNVAPTAVCR